MRRRLVRCLSEDDPPSTQAEPPPFILSDETTTVGGVAPLPPPPPLLLRASPSVRTSLLPSLPQPHMNKRRFVNCAPSGQVRLRHSRPLSILKSSRHTDRQTGTQTDRDRLKE